MSTDLSAGNAEVSQCPVAHLRSPEKFNPFTPQFFQSPPSVFMEAQQEQPIFFSPVMNMWVVTRHDDLKMVMQDTETFISGGAFSFPALVAPEALKVMSGSDNPMDGLNHPIYRYSFINVDAPVRNRFRSNFQRAFTPRQINILEPQIRELIHDLLADLRSQKRAEVITTFCNLLPLQTMCRLVGIPDDDVAQIKRWTTDYIRLPNPGWSLEEQRTIGQSVVDYYAYMLALVKRYVNQPSENLISALLESRQSDAEPLLDEEIAALMVNLVLAGHETTAALLGNTLHSLLSQRELWNYFCKHPERSAAAVDEFIRHGGSAIGLFRQTSRDAVIGEGEHVILLERINH